MSVYRRCFYLSTYLSTCPDSALSSNTTLLLQVVRHVSRPSRLIAFAHIAPRTNSPPMNHVPPPLPTPTSVPAPAQAAAALRSPRCTKAPRPCKQWRRRRRRPHNWPARRDAWHGTLRACVGGRRLLELERGGGAGGRRGGERCWAEDDDEEEEEARKETGERDRKEEGTGR
ncbi:uncharacterized protein IWZ02DRAFT_453144 [Phyllosticta citriasiana]|uniref:Uncharacterized protein n=1 Tax=Phyllosticta citriasiana TaxID=595635 RepID=A0ABR1KYD9_9PEZI